jgi:CubicO group peptidase (beta-lactamase class C family)
MMNWRVLSFVVVLAIVYTRAWGGWIVLCDDNTYSSAGLPEELSRKLTELTAQSASLKSVSFCPVSDGWVVLYNKNGHASSGIPKAAVDTLNDLAAHDTEIKSIVFTPWRNSDGWIIFHGKNGHVEENFPPSFVEKVDTLAGEGADLYSPCVIITGSLALLHDKNGYWCEETESAATLRKLRSAGAKLRCMAFTNWNGWVIVHDGGFASSNIPEDASRSIETRRKQGKTIRSIAFCADDIRLSQHDAATRQRVLDLMAHYKVPGISIALIDKGKIAWSRGYGVVTHGGKAITVETRFQAGSISKPVSALGALRLVEQGKLGLDDDLNRYLTSWKIPKSAFTDKTPCTLRQALSHSAGLTVHGFPGYKATQTPATLIEVLNGGLPANSAAVMVDSPPGKECRYSGGGYCVVQQAMMDASGKPFPQLMDELVLGPVKMTNSTFVQPLPAELRPLAATGHDKKGKPIEGNYHTYPEMAPAGLWTTPSDLAGFAIALQQASQNDPQTVLDPKTVQQMLSKQISTGRLGGWGLGVALHGSGAARTFDHGGRNAGFDADLIAYPQTGQGAVIMLNCNETGGLATELMRDLGREYRWPN